MKSSSRIELLAESTSLISFGCVCVCVPRATAHSNTSFFCLKEFEDRELPWLPKILKKFGCLRYVPKIFKSQHITHHQSIINYHLVPIKKTRKLWACVPPWLALTHLSGMFLFRCMNCIGIVKIQWMPSCNTSPRRVCL